MFLLPVDPADVAALQVEGRVECTIARAQADPEVSGLRVATSTNWWFSILALELCGAWRVDGLGFLGDSSLRILSPDEASASARAVAELIQHLRTNPIPCLTRDLGPELEALEGADRTAAADAAAPVHEVDEATGAVHSFFQFLATLEQAGREAGGSGRHLLFYAPQP